MYRYIGMYRRILVFKFCILQNLCRLYSEIKNPELNCIVYCVFVRACYSLFNKKTKRDKVRGSRDRLPAQYSAYDMIFVIILLYVSFCLIKAIRHRHLRADDQAREPHVQRSLEELTQLLTKRGVHSSEFLHAKELHKNDFKSC